MDNFFKFIDNLNESILVLYDKSFFYMNQYLLFTLRYIDKIRPVSLKQIIDPQHLQTLKKMSEDDISTIVLKMKNGIEKNYTAQLFPFQFEHSYCQCFMLSSKEEIDQEFITINWLVQKLPFPVIVFDKFDNTFQTNDPFDKQLEIKIQNFADLSNQFSISGDLDFSNQEMYSIPSTNNNNKFLHVLQHSTKTFYTFKIGIIQSKIKSGESADLIQIKQSFDQSIKRLQQLNGSETKFSHINSQEIADEIDTLKNLFKDINNDLPSGQSKFHQIDLSEIVINELEVLKSNEFFREKIHLNTELETCTALIKGDLLIGIDTLKDIIAHTVKVVCFQQLNNIVFKTFEMEDRVFLQIIGDRDGDENDASAHLRNEDTNREKSNGLYDVIQNFQNQFQNMDVQVNLDEEFEEYFDLTLIFNKN